MMNLTVLIVDSLLWEFLYDLYLDKQIENVMQSIHGNVVGLLSISIFFLCVFEMLTQY
jgi:hypothetical protein